MPWLPLLLGKSSSLNNGRLSCLSGLEISTGGHGNCVLICCTDFMGAMLYIKHSTATQFLAPCLQPFCPSGGDVFLAGDPSNATIWVATYSLRQLGTRFFIIHCHQLLSSWHSACYYILQRNSYSRLSSASLVLSYLSGY